MIIIFYENVFDCRSECKFGEPLSLLLSPKTVIRQILTHIMSFNLNKREEIGALCEFVFVILLLISNVYFKVFDILHEFYCGAGISTIIVIFLLRAQTIAFDSSARAIFNDIFDNTVSIGCGCILCSTINNYGDYQIYLNFVATSLILQTFEILLISLDTLNRDNMNSGTFNEIANDIKYLIHDRLFFVISKILFHVLAIPYSECGRQLCVPIFNIMFENGVLTMKIGTIGNIVCAITYTYIDSHNEKQDGQVSTNFNNAIGNNGFYQTTTNYGSNLALIGGVLCNIFAILLSLSIQSIISSIHTISSASDLNTNEMQGFGGVVLVVPSILLCALALSNRTSAREQTIKFVNAPPANAYDNTFDSYIYESNFTTVNWLALDAFDLGIFNTIGAVFICAFYSSINISN